MINYAKLKGLMAERGVEVTKLAEMLGVSRQSASAKINGKAPITLTDARIISNALKMTKQERDMIFLRTVSSQRRQHEDDETGRGQVPEVVSGFRNFGGTRQRYKPKSLIRKKGITGRLHTEGEGHDRSRNEPHGLI